MNETAICIARSSARQSSTRLAEEERRIAFMENDKEGSTLAHRCAVSHQGWSCNGKERVVVGDEQQASTSDASR